MLTLPSPFTSPQQEHAVHSSVALANFWMRLLPSATKTFPLPSTATPSGSRNCPSPLPWLPHFVRKVPVFVNFWIRLLPESATKTCPLPSTATPSGSRSCPSPLPWLPHLVTKGQGSVCALHTHAQEFPPE